MPILLVDRPLPTAAPSAYRMKSYDALYARRADPWSSAAKGSGRKRFQSVSALIAGQRFGRVLEIGCAGGFFLPRLARAARAVLGVDVSAAAAARAAKRCAALKNVKVRAANFMTLRAGRFDLAAALYVLSEFEAPVAERMVEKIAAALRPRGLFLCAVPARAFGFFRPSRFRRSLLRGFEILEEIRFATAGRSSRYGHWALLARRK